MFWKYLWPLGFLALFACQTPKSNYDAIKEGLNNRFHTPYIDSQPYDVYYATNRSTVGNATACNNSVYGVTTGKNLTFGVCRVQVPINRPVGSLSSSSDPNSDTQINFQIAQQEAFDEPAFTAALAASTSDEILIFVHGFNVRFEEAVYRAAQLGIDGKYQGQLVLFSWPAGAVDRLLQGAYLLQTYKENKANAAGSIEAFKRVLTAAAATKKRIHVVVHSMGHQVVLPALADLAGTFPPKTIQELILNAPDFAVDDFKKILPAIQSIAARTTVYCSPSDNALAASMRVNGNARLGSCSIMDGIDTIDVSGVDTPVLGLGGLGHGYYAGRPIIGDVTQLLLGMEAQRRMFIKRTVPALQSNFALRP